MEGSVNMTNISLDTEGLSDAQLRELANFQRDVEHDTEISHIMAATPFSSIARSSYGSRLKPWIFKRYFYVGEGLERCKNELLQTFDDETKNLALISGYQGCGKTVFVHYLAEELAGWANGWRVSSSFVDFEKVASASTLTDGTQGGAGKFKNSLVAFLKSTALATDAGPAQDARLLLAERRDAFCRLFERSRTRIEGMQLDYGFIEFAEAYSDLPDAPRLNQKKRLVKLCGQMRLQELIFAACFFHLALEALRGDARFRWVLVFDNLDDEIDEKKISQFIDEFISFATNDADFFDGLREIGLPGCDLSDCDFYRNFMFIFCLRDTNTAKFTAHVRDRGFYTQCDISESIPRKDIIARRIGFLDGCDLAGNDVLARQVGLYRSLLKDRYFFNRIYPLFNNSQRKVSRVLQDVFVRPLRSSLNEEVSQQYNGIMTYGMAYREKQQNDAWNEVAYGAHGMLFRLVSDKLRDERYLGKIGGLDRKISVPRLILTLLYNRCPAHCDGGVPPEAKMTLAETWDALGRIDGIDEFKFADAVREMHALFESKYWSHLLEIDSETDLTTAELIEEIDGVAEVHRRTNLYITCAGRIFVRVMSPHFEYFASRYASNYQPLYCASNLRLERGGEEEGQLRLCELLQKVWDGVQQCAEHVRLNDCAIAKAYFEGRQDDLFRSSYLYESQSVKPDWLDGHQTHVERIVASHIGYIDAYRRYLLRRCKVGNFDGEGSSELQELASDRQLRDRVITVLLVWIKRYILLLEEQESGHITPFGANLLRMFKAAYLRVVNSCEGATESMSPIGDLGPIREEYNKMDEQTRARWRAKLDSQQI